MKKLMVVIIGFLFLGTTGCASLIGPKTVDPNYAAYERIMIAQFEADRQPLLDLELDPEGKVTNIQMFPQPRHIKVEQKRVNPFFRLAEVALRYLGYVGIVWQTGDALESIVEASKGNTTNMNSFNNNSENSGSIESITDYSDAKTDVLTTDVETSQ